MVPTSRRYSNDARFGSGIVDIEAINPIGVVDAGRFDPDQSALLVPP